MEVPPLMRFTGTLHLPQEKGSPVHSLTIRVHDTEWQFWLTDVQALSGMNYGWMILSDIFPPELRLAGPADLLRPLQNPAIAGKPLTVEGRLYTANRKLLVTAVEKLTEQSS